MRKKYILINALSRTPWIGGIYYRKNIINMILSNENIRSRYSILLVVNKKHENVFECFKSKIEILTCKDDINIAYAAGIGAKCLLKYNIKYIFPIMDYKILRLFGVTCVSWIADFQHCYYPDFFSNEEINKRNRSFSRMAESDNPLILSSNSCKEDLKKYFNCKRNNIHVVHFTSCIDDELTLIKNINKSNVLDEFNVTSNKYAIVCNQFWKHKNHKIVLEAINELKNDEELKDIKFVFTGELSDRRNPEYINELRDYIENSGIKDRLVITGFISRTKQLILIENSSYIIQPSLFEGWSTVVEDGKKLNKIMLLSDIEVHKEQANENCVLFNPLNKDDLVDKIRSLLNGKTAIACRDNTYEYSKSLENIFK